MDLLRLTPPQRKAVEGPLLVLVGVTSIDLDCTRARGADSTWNTSLVGGAGLTSVHVPSTLATAARKKPATSSTDGPRGAGAGNGSSSGGGVIATAASVLGCSASGALLREGAETSWSASSSSPIDWKRSLGVQVLEDHLQRTPTGEGRLPAEHLERTTSAQPAHPSPAFRGSDQVGKNRR